jgi:hypothetical protein
LSFFFFGSIPTRAEAVLFFPACFSQASQLRPAKLNLRNWSVRVAVFATLASAALAQSISISSPENGAIEPSPTHFVVNAQGGGYPVAAVWIYIDNQPAYETTSANIDTYLTLAAGPHKVVPTVWNTAGQVANTTLNMTVSTTTGVTISSPGEGATVSSPVQFVASAQALPRTIEAMIVYIDGNPVYTIYGSSLDTSIAVSAGSHLVTVHAWDNTGAVYAQSETITVTASGGNTQYQSNFTATSNWTAQLSQADGSILYVPTLIDPYFANIAAIGMTKDPNRMSQVTAWMNWYINHLNWPDQWGLYGTVYNYNVDDGVESSTNDADSTDSYAATFLTLAWNAWLSGDSNARSFITSIAYQLDVIGGVLIQTQQSDGLTWAKPNYQIKYLMDNSEGYRGLRDLASLFQALGNSQNAAYYNAAADSMQNGIYSMWLNGTWAVYKDYYGNYIAPNMGTWYPDATAQVFPALMGVVASSDGRAQQSYNAFNAAWPGWPTLSFNSQDPFPWCLVGTAAAAMGDNNRLTTYIQSVQTEYVDNSFPWPFYNAEAGWFMRANYYMMGGGS